MLFIASSYEFTNVRPISDFHMDTMFQIPDRANFSVRRAWQGAGLVNLSKVAGAPFPVLVEVRAAALAMKDSGK
jgi:hypothetical protein